LSRPPERWRVPEEAAGERLDRYLAGHYEVPRNRVAGWIRDGRVRLDGAPVKPSARLAGGQELACAPAAPAADLRLQPEAGPLAVIHEEAGFAVLDKPAGLVVHPGAGRRSGTLVHRLLARYPEIATVGGPGRPGIVHRLDRETTGVLVVARTDAVYLELARAFAERRVDKRYLAIVWGAPESARGLIDRPIGRHPTRRKEMAVVPGGRPARTRYRVLARAAGAALLELALETGRTHQIRVHLKAAGRPLVGDPVYGEARWKGSRGPERTLLRDFPRPALHAWRLGFEHPAGAGALRFEAPPPADLEALWLALAGRPLGAELPDD